MRFASIYLILIFGASLACGRTVVINELMADNATVASDADGEFDDWIELYNDSDAAVDLAGFTISDDAENPWQWVIPDTSIAAHGFLIIWADNDDGQPGLHANFKLSADGETVVLSNASGELLDHVVFGAQATDVSYGRFPDGTGDWQLMVPTFGEPNDDEGPSDYVPGEEIFHTLAVHQIELEFYVDSWADTLAYNYEVLDEEYMPVRLTFDNAVVMDSVGIRYKGNSTYHQSQGTPKKPLKLSFSKFIDGGRLYGIKKLNLHNGAIDPSCIRETMAYNILRQFVPAPRTSFADVYVNGELLGFYTLVEQVDEVFLSQHFDSNGYNLYKAGDEGAPLTYISDNQADYEIQYELKTNEDENNWSRFITMIDVLNNTSDEEFVDIVGQWLDFDSVLRLLAFNMVVSNFDSYTGSARNYYFYDNEDTGQFVMMPWDTNEIFGVYSNGWDVFNQDILQINNLDSRPLNRRILENDSLRQVYYGYIDLMMNDAASPDSVTTWVNTLSALVEPHVLADENKLYPNELFYANMTEDVHIEAGRLVPGITHFSTTRYDNLISQLDSEIVYPGDTNNDGFVDEYDILPIGLYFLATGQARTAASNSWQEQRCFGWEIQAATYADANGDGVVDEKDVVVIGINWAKVHDAPAVTFTVNLDDPEVVASSREHLEMIYNGLSGEGVAVSRMKTMLASILETEASQPMGFVLEQNYPNPFNQETKIRFTLPEQDRVTLSLINILGQTVLQPIHKSEFTAGSHTVSLDVAGLPSGVYFYRLQTDRFDQTRKLVLSK